MACKKRAECRISEFAAFRAVFDDVGNCAVYGMQRFPMQNVRSAKCAQGAYVGFSKG